MLGHRHTPAGITPVATGASHPSAAAATGTSGVDNNTRIS
jgi:hypothetical protein